MYLTQPMPDALEAFLTEARSAYTTAKTEPYLTVLKDEGYDAAALHVGLNTLEALRAADIAQAKQIGDAQKATAERTKSVEPLRQFRAKARRVSRRVFRNQPEQLAKLDF